MNGPTPLFKPIKPANRQAQQGGGIPTHRHGSLGKQAEGHGQDKMPPAKAAKLDSKPTTFKSPKGGDVGTGGQRIHDGMHGGGGAGGYKSAGYGKGGSTVAKNFSNTREGKPASGKISEAASTLKAGMKSAITERTRRTMGG